jgi:serine/threonine-protein kinase
MSPALVVLVLSLAAKPGTIYALSLDAPADLDGTWLFHEGDDASFADPALADDDWQPLTVPGGLARPALTGVYWLRAHIELANVDRELSLRLGPVDSAGQFFVDGKLVGETGSVDRQLDAHDVVTVWPVPLDATKDGRIVVAIRAWRNPLRADAAPARGGITSGPNWIGKTADVVRDQNLRDLDKLIAGVVVLVVGLYHLQLFRRRREQREYFWFALFSISMATYLLASTDAALWVLGEMPHSRVFWVGMIMTLPTFVQFLWPLLGRPIRWWWRANQAAMTLYALITLCWPTQWFVIKFIPFFELVLMAPLMIATTIVIVDSARRGNREARTLLVGTMALVLAAADNIAMERTTLPLPQIMSAAMAVFVFSMALSLANRFSRVFKELDDKQRLADEVKKLNAQVQARVKDRSEELSKALAKLSHGDGFAPVVQGTTLDGRYAIERPLGAGGMGFVYAGRDLVTGAAVAIKVIRASSVSEVDALHRFLREARAAVSVDHPAIVKMLHVDISGDGLFYQAQELVEGEPLDARLQRGAIDAPLVARAGSVLAGALAAAHDKGVIHRDVKPSNIMLTSTPPGVKLLDFGVAKITSSAAEHTGTGRHIGTPAYMAPEQRYIGDVDVTEQVDVYALGVLLYQMATGGLPGRVLDATADARLLDLAARCRSEEPSARPTSAELAVLLHKLADELGAPLELEWGSVEPPPPQGITDLLRDLVRTP